MSTNGPTSASGAYSDALPITGELAAFFARLAGMFRSRYGHDREQAWVELALDAAAHLREFRRPFLLSRPAEVPVEDRIAWRKLKRARGRKPSPEDRATAEAFYPWRWAVIEQETVAAANAQALARIVRALAGVEGCEPVAAVAAIEAHLRDEYGLRLDPSWDEVELYAAARRAVRDEDVLPTWMLNDWHPPGSPEGDDDETV